MMFSNKSRVVDGDDSGIDYYSKGSERFSHKSRVVTSTGETQEETPRQPITPSFSYSSVSFDDDGQKFTQKPGEPYTNSYMR